MTIRIVDVAELPFEQIVAEELGDALAAHGLQLAPPFPKFKNRIVTFRRQRLQGIKEKIEIIRALHDAEHMRAEDAEGEVEAEPIDFGDEVHGADPYWVSRHSLTIQFIVDGATNWLQTDGRAGVSDEHWWDFTDEQDLRRLLRDRLLPLILTAGMQRFDDRLEDYEMGRISPSAA